MIEHEQSIRKYNLNLVKNKYILCKFHLFIKTWYITRTTTRINGVTICKYTNRNLCHLSGSTLFIGGSANHDERERAFSDAHRD